MADSFLVAVTPSIPTFSQELPTTAVTGHPYLAHCAVVGVLNGKGSGKVLRVRSIRIDEAVGRTVATNTNFSVQTVSAVTSSGSVAAAVALDSSNAALPAQVVCYVNPAAITTTNAVIADAPNLAMTNMVTALRSFNAQAVPLRSQFQWRDATTAETQKITLREGQGIAVHTNGAASNNFRAEFNVLVRNASSGACYLYKVNAAATSYAIWALLNGSGSGVVLEVLWITIGEVGDDTVPQFTVEQIDGLDDTTGSAVTPFLFDSTASLPAQVVVRERCTVLTEGAKHGALIAVPQRQWSQGAFGGTGPALATPPKPKRHEVWGHSPYQRGYSSDVEWVLREGDGLAIMQRNAGSLGAWRIALWLTAESSLGSSVFPPEGDVDDGVVYGPNGTDYTGTLAQPGTGDVRDGIGYGAAGSEFTGDLTLPAEADVLLGVQYGAAGLEFTGTLAGGGGGTVIWNVRRSR